VKFLYGYALRHPDEQCAIRPDAPSRTLCGRQVGFLPAHDEDYTPRNLHAKCRDLIFGEPKTLKLKTAQVDYGTCPACHGRVPVFEGRIQSHGEARVGGDGVPYASEVACVGVNLKPKADR
jgi:hypothetical protein